MRSLDSQKGVTEGVAGGVRDVWVMWVMIACTCTTGTICVVISSSPEAVRVICSESMNVSWMQAQK